MDRRRGWPLSTDGTLEFFAAACLSLFWAPACTSEPGAQAVEASVDVALRIEGSADTLSTAASCPLLPPNGTPC